MSGYIISCHIYKYVDTDQKHTFFTVHIGSCMLKLTYNKNLNNADSDSELLFLFLMSGLHDVLHQDLIILTLLILLCLHHLSSVRMWFNMQHIDMILKL